MASPERAHLTPEIKQRKVKLYMFSGSHAVLSAQLMLAHYRRVNLPPAAHALVMLGLGFETMTVPGLKVDGRRVQGTRWISRYLDELVPAPPLFPADPSAAGRWRRPSAGARSFRTRSTRLLLHRQTQPQGREERPASRAIPRSLPMRAMLHLTTPAFLEMCLEAGRPWCCRATPMCPPTWATAYDEALELLAGLGVTELAVFERRRRSLERLAPTGARLRRSPPAPYALPALGNSGDQK